MTIESCKSANKMIRANPGASADRWRDELCHFAPACLQSFQRYRPDKLQRLERPCDPPETAGYPGLTRKRKNHRTPSRREGIGKGKSQAAAGADQCAPEVLPRGWCGPAHAG